MFRRCNEQLEVLLAHPGGPYWTRKDIGAWTLPKGEYTDEQPLDAAKREFIEETGFAWGEPLLPLGEIRQASGKTVMGWAFEGDCAPDELVSNTFEMEWPPKSGRLSTYPEIDRVAWFDAVTARRKLLPAQVPFIDRLEALVGKDAAGDRDANNAGRDSVDPAE